MVNHTLKTKTNQQSIKQAWTSNTKRKRADLNPKNPTTPAKTTIAEASHTKPQTVTPKLRTGRKQSFTANTNTKKDCQRMKADRMETKKQQYQQKIKRRYIARIRKYVGKDTKVKVPKREKKRRRLLNLQEIKKLEAANRKKTQEPKYRPTPRKLDPEEEEPTHRNTKRHRNKGQRLLDEDSESDTDENLGQSTEDMEERSRGNIPQEPD
jgi:hypothetical protein